MHTHTHTNPSTQVGCDTRSISQVVFNRFKFSSLSLGLVGQPKVKEPSQPSYFPKLEGE